MYDYSPIRKLYIQNFRNLGNVEIDFSESPIVALVGENEAGKTSVIKAFATCALHASPRDQKDYIRDNTKMFGVAIELENGTRIVRVKEAAGINSYQINDKDNKCLWSSNKISEGLPAEVQKLMGLIAEPETGEFLHIRTYEDKLLFVVTPNSTNYKVMYNALKVEQLTKAIKIGSNEINTHKANVSANESSIQTLGYQLKSINVIDTQPLVSIRDSLKQQLSMLDKIERAKALLDRINVCEEQLGALALINEFKLESISELTASKIDSVSKILNRKNEMVNLLSILDKTNNIEEIDTSIASRLSSIIDKENMLRDKIANAGALAHVSEISEISEVLAVQLNKAITLLNKLDKIQRQKDTLDVSKCEEITDATTSSLDKLARVSTLVGDIESKNTQLEQINAYIEQVHDYMKQCGVAVETCPKCGESVIFDVDKLEV